MLAAKNLGMGNQPQAGKLRMLPFLSSPGRPPALADGSFQAMCHLALRAVQAKALCRSQETDSATASQPPFTL